MKAPFHMSYFQSLVVITYPLASMYKDIAAFLIMSSADKEYGKDS